jgi:hypothetical protein
MSLPTNPVISLLATGHYAAIQKQTAALQNLFSGHSFCTSHITLPQPIYKTLADSPPHSLAYVRKERVLIPCSYAL